MKNSLVALLLAVLACLVSGCSSVSLTASKSPNANLSDYKSFYVEKMPADTHGVDVLIADRLRVMGLQASTGDLAAAGRVDAVVTYQDKWMWDLTMYMIELNVQIRAADTRMSVATGRSFRTSLARKPPAEMVRETLDEIFGQK